MDNKVRKALWIVAGILFLVAGCIKAVKGRDVSGVVVSFAASALSFANVYVQGRIKNKKS